jgi:hypothetical protein
MKAADSSKMLATLPTASTFREEEEMKAADSSKMLATFYLMTWYHVPKDIILVTAIKNTNLSLSKSMRLLWQ